MRRDLERVEVPDAEAARERAHGVVVAAYGEREAIPVRRRPLRLAAVCAVLAVAAVVGAAFSPPGEAVVDRIREVIGVERAQPALFRLPTDGRLLVASDSGVWVVEQDGKKRLLPGYREASWSPFGRFVVATKANELAALEPDGDVRWTLARRGVRFPRWTGTKSDTRIAYLTGRRLHVVAGDGTRDGDAGGLPDSQLVAPAWQPGKGFVLAYANRFGRIRTFAAGRGSDGWSDPAQSRPLSRTSALEWTSDGAQLLVAAHWRLLRFDARSGAPLNVQRVVGLQAIAVRPGSPQVALLRRPGEVSQVVVGGSVVFSCGCELRGLMWSPDGNWLLVGSPEADQWIFVRPETKRIVAVSNVSEQFRSRSFPRVEGWCC